MRLFIDIIVPVAITALWAVLALYAWRLSRELYWSRLHRLDANKLADIWRDKYYACIRPPAPSAASKPRRKRVKR